MVEREWYDFYVEMVYEKLPKYYAHYKAIGHDINSHLNLMPKNDVEEDQTTKMGMQGRRLQPSILERWVVWNFQAFLLSRMIHVL